MPRDKELDYGDKIRIEFLKSKMSIQQIAKEINRSKSVVNMLFLSALEGNG